MQLRTYAKKNNLVATEVIAALKLDNSNVDWVLTSVLEPSDQSYLDGHFGLNQPAKKVLQLPGNNSELDTAKPTGELVEQLRENATNLTADDVETLRVNVQRQIVEENAELAAFRDFQHYQTTYDTTKRNLIVNDIYQRLDNRNKNRKQFQDDQELIVSESVTEKSSDLMTEMLGILKADKYQSSFLTSKLEQI
ncbi:hypothetical protein [Nostoc sp. 'Peltigera membranacea cyanobiont' N6]|uniref:hypothetical protein n=1 Tax=Nostoc sp. 'Peltigera membranacea cyanobiont' N6 TaxID=1261031 RepID=UPI000CF3163F|nr:hypothetical protein [Nostoc sp. 'Peltigera membranacea cyanobiont' N6]AVH68648.1 hypothetical protein NPM_90007 [Nostoc sp. 'Peltigera membranacea cyanobiont' N6]